MARYDKSECKNGTEAAEELAPAAFAAAFPAEEKSRRACWRNMAVILKLEGSPR